MNKVKLQLDDLQVESFAVEGDAAEEGTVHGQQVHAESGLESQCWTWCTSCRYSMYFTNCPGDDACAQSFYESCRYTECPEDNTYFATCDTCDPAICPPAV